MINDILIILKITLFVVLGSAVSTLPVEPFAIMCYCTITFGVIYTVVLPKYRRTKKYKEWVKKDCPKDERYKWEDVQ